MTYDLDVISAGQYSAIFLTLLSFTISRVSSSLKTTSILWSPIAFFANLNQDLTHRAGVEQRMKSRGMVKMGRMKDTSVAIPVVICRNIMTQFVAILNDQLIIRLSGKKWGQSLFRTGILMDNIKLSSHLQSINEISVVLVG